MVAEQSDEEEATSPEAKRLQRNKRFWRQMKAFMDNMFQQEKRGNVYTERNRRGSLEEKHFRRMEKFGGETSKFRLWMFNLGVAIGTVDRKLAEEIKSLIKRDDNKKIPEDCDPRVDRIIDRETYN
eukprot:5994792-Karenia_brevis.AAC.1